MSFHSSLLRKNTLLRMLYSKERCVGSIAAKRVNRYILLQSSVMLSNNILEWMFKLRLLKMFEIRIECISLDGNMMVGKTLAPLIT